MLYSINSPVNAEYFSHGSRGNCDLVLQTNAEHAMEGECEQRWSFKGNWNKKDTDTDS